MQEDKQFDEVERVSPRPDQRELSCMRLLFTFAGKAAIPVWRIDMYLNSS
jgi:hypothetical protein